MTTAALASSESLRRSPRHGRREALDSLFAPRNIAIVGASDKIGSVGHALLRNLKLFEGRIFPINPKHRLVGGLETFEHLGLVPEKIDLVVIATPAPTVPGIIRDCAKIGAGAVTIISAGFRECGKDGAALEQQCLAEARRGQIRLLGPNCLGLMVPNVQLNATFAKQMAKPGNIAFLSQSGALCTAVLDWSFRENVGFSAFVSVGSMLDVGWGDLLTHFGDDPHTKSILCYMESVGDDRSFLSAAREVSLNKPVIVLKVGRTNDAARAAASHTGALTGSDAVLDAAFQRAGVLRVNTVGELFNMAELLGKQPRPHGSRLTIVTNAGGPGVLATDALIAGGGQLAELTPATQEALDHALPAHWSHGNPIDVLGDANASRFIGAIELAAKDPQTDGVLVILTPQAMTDVTGTAEAVRVLARETAKPLLTSWMGGAGVDAAKTILNAANIPTFEFPDTAARAFAQMWRYSDNLRSLYETPATTEALPEAEAGRAAANEVISEARKAGRRLLTAVESGKILGAYGIETIETHVALTEDAAVRHAEQLGFPVVVKLLSETVTHKTDVGGVELDLRTAASVRYAWKKIHTSVCVNAGHEHFLGVTVQPMVSHGGYELILGSSIDPQFGPVILFGTGGQLVEVFRDTVLGLPPLNATLARRLIEQTKVFTALNGVRGRKSVNLCALEQLIVRFSQLVAEQRWIAEIDVNPLLVSPEGMIALDARVLLHPSECQEETLPQLAIRPYPSRYVTSWKLRDGTPVTIRPIKPEDEPLMVNFYQAPSEHSVYMRYFAPLKLDVRIAHDRLSRICSIDYGRKMVLVVELSDPQTHKPEIIGIGALIKSHGTNEAEFALDVSDPWQKHGIGTHLLKLLVQIGHHEKVARITATILGVNHEMQRIASKVGFNLQPVEGDSELRAELVL